MRGEHPADLPLAPGPSAPAALITGVSGQDGTYLADLLLAKGYQVAGTIPPVRGAPGARQAPLSWLDPRVVVIEADMRDRDALAAALLRVRPDEVYHLAAQSKVAGSWDDPELTADVNALGTLRLLDAIRRQAPEAKVVVAGSSEVFGRQSPAPQHEETPRDPLSPYGASKHFAESMTALYRDRFGLFACTAILFGHESPRRPPGFVSQKIARGVVEIAAGRQTELVLGNLNVVRDWGFAGDHVEAMWRMAQQEIPSDYVIGTGTGHTIAELCAEAFAFVGVEGEGLVRSDPALLRPDDVPVLVADPTRARERLGWTPRVDFTALVHMLVAAVRESDAASH